MARGAIAATNGVGGEGGEERISRQPAAEEDGIMIITIQCNLRRLQ